MTLPSQCTIFAAALLGVAALPSTVAGSETATAAELDRFLESWTREFEGVESLEVRFRQEKRLRLLRRPLICSGRILLKKGRLLCSIVDARGDPETTLQLDGKTLKIHYPKLERLELFDAGAARAPAMAFPVFGMDAKALKRDFVATLERKDDDERVGGDASTRRTLKLVPRDSKSPVGELVMVFDGKKIVEVRQSERGGGNRVTMRILEFKRNAKIADGDLALEVPAGTKTVRPLGVGRGPKGPSSSE